MRLFLTLLALVLAFGFIDARRLLGSEKCTWGPSYWCSGLRQSSKCQATSHCIDRVWSTNPYPEDDDDVCKICKEMVKEARDQLISNETQGELLEVFEGSCALIPIKLIADECKNLVDEFVPELVETLSSEMNPDTVCTVAGLCNSKRIDKLLEKFFYYQQQGQIQDSNVQEDDDQEVPELSDCDMCREESKKLSEQIYDADKDLVLDKILEMCGSAPGLSTYTDACKAIVLENFDDIYWVITHLNEGLCDVSGMCPATSTTSQVSVSSHVGDVQCEFCEKVIQHWIDTWTANTTQDEFKEVLEALCNKMAKDERREHCLHIVDDYYIPIFNYILHELDPKMLCTLAGLCNGENQGPLVSNNAPITVLLAARTPSLQNPMENEEESSSSTENRLIGGYFVPQTAVVVEKPGCVICEYAIHHLQEMLGQNNTAEAVEEALEKVCSYLPKSVADQCDDLVEKYGTGIIEVLTRGVDAQEVCTILALCNNQGQNSDNLLMQSQNPIMELKKKDDNCALCQYALETVFEVLENKDNEEEVKNALETVCRFMPASIEDKCEEYIEAYAETILQFILQSMTPDEICAELGVCESKSVLVKISEKDSKCVLCEYVMSTVDQLLSNKSTEAEVRQALEEVCSYLPGTIKDQCTNFVDHYSDMIIDFIAHQITPEQICQQIGLCQTHAPESNAEQFEMIGEVDIIIQEDTVDQVESDRPYCTLCEYAIGEVDKMITDKKNTDEIKNVLDRICYELSNPIRDECVKMVNQYTDEIVQMFVAEYTPQEVCSELGLCDPPQADEINDNTILQFEEEVPEENDVSEKPLCALCEFAMDILEKQILTNRTMDMAEHAIEMLCSYMPETIADKCIDFVQEYGDEIVDLIIKAEMNPDQVCAAITLCTSPYTTFDARPVGGHRCTWGPAFWCQSRIHARACGTTRHCEDNVWNN